MQAVRNRLGTSALDRRTGWLARQILGRRFPAHAPRRMLVYYHPSAIGWAQIYPFIFYADQIRAHYGVETRFLPVDEFLERLAPQCGEADIVLVQPWFTVEPDTLERALSHLRDRRPNTQISFIDSYAHSDLRLGRYVDPYIQFYLKKSLFRDRSLYLRAWRGDTNLTEFFGDLHGLEQTETDWQTPESLLPKLRLSPNFHMASNFLRELMKNKQLPDKPRQIDIQIRLGCKGSPWYSAMRNHSLEAVSAIPGLILSPPGKVSYKEYMAEMARAKICFSPFGYGELCWRDIEGVMAGAVLLKPDMDHLETLPDLYEKNITYQAVEWDLSDLPQVADNILSNPALQQDITQLAYAKLANYAQSGQFVSDMDFLFENAPH